MASIAKDPGGRRRILFVDPCDKDRRVAIRLGKVSQRTAQHIKLRVERLVEAKEHGCPIDPETARWVKEFSRNENNLADKLARAGLIEPPEAKAAESLGPFLEAYIEGRAKLKPNTLRNYRTTERRLVEFFGVDRLLRDLTPGDADEWRQSLLSELSPATVSRDVRRARQFFQAAVRKRIISENPFVDLPTPAQVNSSREYYLSREDTQSVLYACPDNEWRLIVALSRYGGLRCPSEHQALTWDHVDWDRGRIEIPSPKTEHHDRGGSRTIPMFPELRPYLEAAWEAADPGALYVIERQRGKNANLRTQFERIVKRAGLRPWPRLFHNLRATRQTELAADHPLHVVCDWIGNTAAIASKHYLTVTEADFERATQEVANNDPAQKAAQNAAQLAHALGGMGSHKKTADTRKPHELQGLAAQSDSTRNRRIPPRGVEPLSPP